MANYVQGLKNELEDKNLAIGKTKELIYTYQEHLLEEKFKRQKNNEDEKVTISGVHKMLNHILDELNS